MGCENDKREVILKTAEHDWRTDRPLGSRTVVL